MTDDKYRGTVEYFLIYAELIRAARYRGTVTYQELADLIGLPLQGNHMGRELGWYLGTISEDEARYERPMLSAIAVNVHGQTSDGFFDKAKELRRLSSDDPADLQTFWRAEQQAVYTTWQKSFNHQPR